MKTKSSAAALSTTNVQGKPVSTHTVEVQVTAEQFAIFATAARHNRCNEGAVILALATQALDTSMGDETGSLFAEKLFVKSQGRCSRQGTVILRIGVVADN